MGYQKEWLHCVEFDRNLYWVAFVWFIKICICMVFGSALFDFKGDETRGRERYWEVVCLYA